MSRFAAPLLGACLLSAGLGSPVRSADSPTAVKAELKAMAGTWRFVSAENNGTKAAAGDLAGDRWVRDAGGTWSLRRGGVTVVEWRVKALDPAATPKSVDIEVAGGEHKGVVYLGIYELDGDTLRICFAMPDRPIRPTEFKTGEGTGRALSEFKREKK